MPVPVSMQDLSTTAATNSPAGSESPISTDNHHRATQAILRHTQARGADIASATTTDIGAATGYSFNITGTNPITSLGTIAAGILRQATFTGALTLTHNATSLILPSSANITTAAGDVAEFTSLGSGNWKCTSYMRQNGTSVAGLSDGDKGDIIISGSGSVYTIDNNAVTLAKTTMNTARLIGRTTASSGAMEEITVGTGLTLSSGSLSASITSGTVIATTSGTSHDFTSIAAGAKKITLMLSGVSTNGTSPLLVQIGDSGGIENTAYVSTGSQITTGVATGTSTAGVILSSTNAAATANEYTVVATLLDAATNTWTFSGTGSSATVSATFVCGGRKALSATLDRIRLTTVNGTDTFDAGSINILVE
jgi:hypothetical protein